MDEIRYIELKDVKYLFKTIYECFEDCGFEDEWCFDFVKTKTVEKKENEKQYLTDKEVYEMLKTIYKDYYLAAEKYYKKFIKSA